jgi:RNA polymerase sigma-B factor
VIAENMPLARALARRFARPSEPLDDLVQAASIGLIKAVDGFRSDRGSDLGAYAVPTIVGELRRHRREGSWPIRTPRGASPPGGRPVAAPLDETLPAPDAERELELGEDRAVLRQAFLSLNSRERRIVALRFFRDLSQARIGQDVGLSQAQVSRELASAMRKLRSALLDGGRLCG